MHHQYILRELIIHNPETESQVDYNTAISTMSDINIQSVADTSLDALETLWQNARVQKGVNHVPLRQFYSSFHHYRFKEFQQQITAIFGQTSNILDIILSEFLIKVRGLFVHYHERQAYRCNILLLWNCYCLPVFGLPNLWASSVLLYFLSTVCLPMIWLVEYH